MKLNRSATVMPVSDLGRALDHYVRVLGFTKQFDHRGFYAGVELGPVEIHLATRGHAAPGSGDIFIFCDDVDLVFAGISARGGRTDAAPTTQEYGLRDFRSFDPDGNRVSFGTPVC
jgi:predicted enzyme related to lactoylglutathione lyase